MGSGLFSCSCPFLCLFFFVLLSFLGPSLLPFLTFSCNPFFGRGFYFLGSILSQPVPVPGRDKIIPKKPKAHNNKKERQQNQKEKEKQPPEKEARKRKGRTHKKTKKRKGQEQKKGKSPNLQSIENLIQFLQLELCGNSDCENRYTETCRSENEDYQPL